MQASTIRRNAVLPALRVHSAGPRADLRAILRAGIVFAAVLVVLAALWQGGLMPLAYRAW
jgi:hypothetical protein